MPQTAHGWTTSSAVTGNVAPASAGADCVAPRRNSAATIASSSRLAGTNPGSPDRASVNGHGTRSCPSLISIGPNADGRFGVVAIVSGPGVPVGLQRAAKHPVGRLVASWTSEFAKDRAPGRRSTTSTCSIATSGPGSSRSAPTSPTRPRCGSTAMSGPNVRPTGPGSTSSSWPTGSPPARSPGRLQAICDRFGPGDIQAFFDRWITPIPTPFTADRPGRLATGGSCRCAKSRCPAPWCSTIPAAPVAFFEVPGRRQHRHRPPRRGGHRLRPPPSAPPHQAALRAPGCSGPGTEVKIDFSYKHSRVKQYLKEGRALRIETVINKPVRPRRSSPGSSTCPSSSPRPARSTVVCL